MVIAPGTNGIIAHVLLTDNEAVPAQYNHERVIVYRRGVTTNMEVLLVKPLGETLPAGHPALRDPAKKVCNYNGDGNPLHQHENNDWYFYEETFNYEIGPFASYEEGYSALAEYCTGLQMAKDMVAKMELEQMEGVTEDAENNVEGQHNSLDILGNSGSIGDEVRSGLETDGLVESSDDVAEKDETE